MLQPLNDTFRFLQLNWIRLAILCLPVALANSIASSTIMGDVALTPEMSDEELLEAIKVALVPMGMLHLIITPLMSALALSYIRNTVNYAKSSYSLAIAGALKVLPTMGLLVALTVIISVGGLYLFIVPGFFLYFRLSLAPVIIVDQDASITRALKMSWRVSGQYWQELLLGYALIAVAIGVLGTLLGMLIPSDEVLPLIVLTTLNGLLALGYEVYKYRIFQLSLEQ